MKHAEVPHRDPVSDQRVTALLKALSVWIRPNSKAVGRGTWEKQLHGNSVEAGEPADAGTS